MPIVIFEYKLHITVYCKLWQTDGMAPQPSSVLLTIYEITTLKAAIVVCIVGDMNSYGEAHMT